VPETTVEPLDLHSRRGGCRPELAVNYKAETKACQATVATLHYLRKAPMASIVIAEDEAVKMV